MYMKRMGRLEWLIVLGVATLGGLVGAHADMLTWNGGATNDFTAAASWTPAQKPQPGDTLVIQGDVTFTGATFDVGTAGLTIQSTQGSVRCGVSFTGSGDLVIRGNGKAFFQDGACPSLAGDWRLRGGVFEPCPGGMGSGKVYVEDSSKLQVGAVTLTNDVCVVGSGASIAFARAARLMGVLSANADLVLDVAWVDANQRVEIADLRAGTSTVTIMGNAGGANRTLDFTGTVEARLVKKSGACEVRFTGTSEAAETALAVEEGTVSFTGSARWAGPSVTATGEGTVLRFDGNNLTAAGGTVRVADGAKLDVASLTILPALTLGDQALERGTYQAGDLPDNVTGAGILLVGGEVTTWIGGEAGAWSEGTNWSTGVAPKGMVVARFTNEVELAAEAFDFGADGVCIWNSANLIQGTAFAGAGRYRKFGSGQIEYRADSSYTGGTLFTDGSAYLGNTKFAPQAFGAAEGMVELTRNVDGTGPFFSFGAYNVPIANKIRLVGEMKAARIRITNPVNLKGDVESDSDFLIYSGWGWLHADGDFRAPGKTITFEEDDKEGLSDSSYFAGAVDAALVKKGTASLELRGRSSGTANALTAAGGRLRLTAEAAWEGPVAVQNGGLLALDGRDNLSSAATLTVEEGGKVEIAEGVGVRVNALVLNGQKMPVGVYSKANQPAFFDGAGHVVVGKATVVILR